MRLSSRARVRARAAMLATASLALAPIAISAQPGGVAAKCEIDTNEPKELALISIKFQQARAATAPEARKAALMGISKDLDTKPERFAKNPAGYNYVMSQLLSMWAMEPGVGYMPTRGALGFVSAPTETIDLVDALDKNFKAVVAANPSCTADVEALRQNDVWLALTRSALDASNGGKLDSANYYASRSLTLSNASPYPHYVMANVANQKGDKKAAIAHWQATVKAAGTDTAHKDLRSSSMYYIAATQLETAATLSGAEQQAMARDAAAGFTALLEADPMSVDAAAYLQSIADAYGIAKDSAKIASSYQVLMTDPSKFSDLTLTMGGVIATRANKADDALKLFEGAVANNPNSRDALRNLAATYHGRERFKDMFKPAAQLVAIDPNNHDGWMMFAYGYQGLANAEKVPATKKALQDSLLKYKGIADALPVKAEVTNFQRTATGATLVLALEQVAAAGGSYPITVEFLDGKGNVVATATEQSGQLAKGAKKEVTIKGAGAGITAYRYKAIR